MMTSSGTIDYDALRQAAMRSVMRDVLRMTEQSGLPGEHHFYISFDTQADGVGLSERLRAKYQHEMTIVLQHRFWDLAVSDDQFEVKLAFDGVPERLVVPFSAIRVFFDPSVRYAIQFTGASIVMRAPDDDHGRGATVSRFMPQGDELSETITPAPLAAFPSPLGTLGAVPDTDDAAAGDLADLDDEIEDAETALAGHDTEDEAETEPEADEDDDKETEPSGVVVSLDAFRKK